MGMSEKNTWVLIRRYDKLESVNDKLQSSLRHFMVTSGSISDDLKALIFQSINVEDNNTRVLKVRRHDNHLIPLSTLLDGSSQEKPFIIDVVLVHQFCPVEGRIILPNYIDALTSKFHNLEHRVKVTETTLPELTNAQIQAIEDTASQLANCVSFLDRRLDELVPSTWRQQLGSPI